jgi:hypothetical protein
MNSAGRIAVTALGALALFAAASCQAPTRILVRVTTDVDCARETPTPIIAVGGVENSPDEAPLAPIKVRCKPQSDQGTVVVVPPESVAKDSRLSIRVAMRYRSDLAPVNEDCNLASSPLCIVQRRALRFEPNGTIDLPIELNANCRGVFCSALATCNRAGQCVSATVEGCAAGANCDPTLRDPDGGVLPDATVVPPGDAGTDGSLGGEPDVSVPDASVTDASDAGQIPVIEPAAGYFFTCARFDDGSVKCWGDNTNGQLGLGDALARGNAPGEMGSVLPTVDLGPGRSALQVAVGYHACARLDDSSVKCWGFNDDGQLGLGDVQHRGDELGELGANLPVVDLGPGRSALQVAANVRHTCARLDNGTLKCWGRNGSGRLGLGDTQSRGDGPGEMGANLPAVDLGPGRTALEVALGSSHTCARLDDGSVKCWGRNDKGQLGLGDVQDRGDGAGEMGTNLPVVNLGPGRTALQLALGLSHTCARLDDGSIKCWGDNGSGQLGLGDTQVRGGLPGQMGASLPAIDLGPGRLALQVAAASAFTCARLDNNTVKCWGNNATGLLGVGDTQARGDGPGEMGANLPAIDLGPGRLGLHVAASVEHTCARLDNGSIKCWGFNGNGCLGLGDTQSRGATPAQMGANLPAVSLR